MTLKESFARRFRNRVAPVYRNYSPPRQSLVKVLIFAAFFKKWENFKCGPAQHLITHQAGNAFHCPVPDCVTILAIEGKDAVKTDVKEVVKKVWILVQVDNDSP